MAAVKLPRQVAAAAVAEVNAWVGCSRTSHLHFDGKDNLLIVLHGAKEVLLYSPWQYAALYPQLEPEVRWQSAARSRGYAARRGAAGAHAGLLDEPCWRAELRAGEMLFIPTGWWHEVLTPRVTLALNVWFKPPAGAALRPTMLHLHSDAYAARAGVKRKREPTDQVEGVRAGAGRGTDSELGGESESEVTEG